MVNKLTQAITVTLTAALILSGCGNFGKNADKPNREDATIIHEDEKAGGSLETGGGYGFTSFDLDIEVDNMDAIETDYEAGKQLVADYNNRITNVNLNGSAAMEELDKFFMHILITKDTAQQEVIDKIVEWYQLENYSKFDLEIDFDDGTRLDIEDVQ
jgi:hypothetical protein